MNKRLFIGIPVSINDEISELMVQLKSTGAPLSFVPLDNLHFTLKFLGEIDEGKIAELSEKLQVVCKIPKKFEITMDGVGIFPNIQYVKVVWIGSKSEKLRNFMENIHQYLSYLREEDYKDTPHLTIARIRSGKHKHELQELISDYKDKVFGKMMVDRIVLYESILTEKGPVYKIEKEFKLK